MPGTLTQKQQIVIGASAGAVIGFSLVWLSLVGIEVITPLAAVPVVKRDWKKLCAVHYALQDMQAYLYFAGCGAELPRISRPGIAWKRLAAWWSSAPWIRLGQAVRALPADLFAVAFPAHLIPSRRSIPVRPHFPARILRTVDCRRPGPVRWNQAA